MLTHDRDAEGGPVLDEDAAVAVEDDAARRAQGQRALMVVLGHLFELRVLRDLQHPETDREDREESRDDVLKDRQPGDDAAAIFYVTHAFLLPPDTAPLRPPTLHRARQELDQLKHHDADDRVADRLSGDRRVRRAEMPQVEQHV